MADQMSKEDWAAKDLQKQASIVAQSCLERAIETVMGLGASGLDNFTLQNVKKRVSETYNYYCDLVWNKTNELCSGNKSDVNSQTERAELPQPTVKQKKLFDIATKKYNYSGESIYNVKKAWPNSEKEMKEVLIKLGVKYD